VSGESPNDSEGLLRALSIANVDFILIGGMAAIVHGAARLTFDLDVVYKRTRDNYQKLVNALGDYQPYLRGAARRPACRLGGISKRSSAV
jgi:hypothetical protein